VKPFVVAVVGLSLLLPVLSPALAADVAPPTAAKAAHSEAAEVAPSPVLEAARTELARTMELLKEQPVPPYFLGYEITETHLVQVAGAFGALIESDETHRRQLDIELRVGSYERDNTHAVRGGARRVPERYSLIELPLDDDPDALRSVIWSHTDGKYRRAVERLTQVRSDVQVKVAEEDLSADFSREEPEEFFEEPTPLQIDRPVWEEKVRRYSAPFARQGDIYQARATLYAGTVTRWFTSSEGASVQTSAAYYRLMISAVTKADDGMELPRYESFFATSPEGLPDDATILETVETMIRDLLALRTAPVVDPYTGPAILSGRAAGVFFHEVFGHRIEGHRQKREEEGQTFKKKVGERILPENFTIVFDPTRRRLAGTDLVGFYRFDNQGVKARPVTVLENGVFRGFLLSRTPLEGFPASNGHGRRQAGFVPVARQSNLIVEVADPLTPDELRARLLTMIREEGKPFGLIFEDIQGGFTMTGRSLPNAFNVLPIMVYRVFPDGREELVRGVDLIGTPLTAFSSIVAAGNEPAVFNGTCGAESGGVPVAAVSPAILVSQIEVQKKAKSQERPPLLPAPPPERDGSP
jgi:predicted Zn-dependent protease